MVGSLDESLPRFLCYIIFPSITFRNIHSRNIKQKKNGVSRPVLRQDGSLTPMYDKRERLTPPPRGRSFCFALILVVQAGGYRQGMEGERRLCLDLGLFVRMILITRETGTGKALYTRNLLCNTGGPGPERPARVGWEDPVSI